MGVVNLIRRLLGSVAGIAATRLELVALEIEQERQRLARLWIHATVTLFLLFIGTALTVGWLLLWVEPAQRVTLAGALALGFLGSAAVAAWRWQRLLNGRRPLLGGLISDLQRGQQGLCGARSAPGDPRPPGPTGPLGASRPGPS